MDVTESLLMWWWPAVLLLGPILALSLGERPPVEGRSRYLARLALPAGLAVLVAPTPLSLAGTLPDHLALGAAYVALCFAAQAVLRGWARATSMIALAVVGVAVGLVVGFLSAWTAPERTVATDCGLAVRLADSSSLSTDFTEVSVLRPLGPFEYRLGGERAVLSERSATVEVLSSVSGCALELRDENGESWVWGT